ncbi:DUF3164 family protein [Candidatus Sodalis sp. SoCistrobi]|uniref:DUF3164 family protein n=1 Tax=Candidatus Sodalis sp. SoCistrobi TaxID=1922216 RepID=UPI000939BDDC|nr:DUF3164 family protein [Candidatus Sodalis sp. SoCistrobi]
MSTNSHDNTVPAGYWQDAKGVLIPDTMVKPIDKERDALVKDIVARARPLHEALRDFKHRAFVDIQALIDLSIEQYGVKRGGRNE